MNAPLLTFAAKNFYRYFTYLKHRDEFVLEDDEHLEERVMATYEQMMAPAKGRKKRGAKRRVDRDSAKGAKSDSEDGQKVVLQEAATAGA